MIPGKRRLMRARISARPMQHSFNIFRTDSPDSIPDRSSISVAVRATSDREPGLAARVQFRKSMLPLESFQPQDAVVSNSLLHHLPDPAALWTTVLAMGKPGAAVLVMDLARPRDAAAAHGIVACHAGAEPEVLRENFFNSLLAAFDPAEVEEQLCAAGLDMLRLAVVSDRHWLVSGRLPA